MEKDILEKLILKEKKSYEEIGRIFNCTGNNIRKRAKKLGIILPQRRKINNKENFNRGKGKKKNCLNCGKDISNIYGNIYCDVNCQHEYQNKKKYDYFLTSPKEYQRVNFNLKVIKRFILKEQNNKCAICGMIDSWNNKKLVFIIDHIDGDAANNIRDNLRCVCPNCDSQLETYKSKNKNGSRYYYRYHKNKEG